jgi:hypothetical protein
MKSWPHTLRLLGATESSPKGDCLTNEPTAFTETATYAPLSASMTGLFCSSAPCSARERRGEGRVGGPVPALPLAWLSWLWTVYTGAAILGVTTAKPRTDALSAILIAAPSPFVVLAYAAAVYAYMPLTLTFDPRDPEEVRTAYARAVQRGWRRLRVALVLSGLAGVSLAVAIGVATSKV